MNDVFALYVAGDMDLFLAEQILDYLDQETSPIVWDAVLDGYQMLKEKEVDQQMDRYLYEYWQVRYYVIDRVFSFAVIASRSLVDYVLRIK